MLPKKRKEIIENFAKKVKEKNIKAPKQLWWDLIDCLNKSLKEIN